MIPSGNSSDRSTLLKTFDKIGEYCHGYFCNAIFLKQDSKTLNVKANVLEETVVDPNKWLLSNLFSLGQTANNIY